MDPNNIVILAIVVTSLATYLSRFLGAVTSENVNVKSKIFQWFNLAAYSTLAALLGRIIVFPAGVLADADLVVRLVVLIVCIFIYVLSKKNLVLPTVFSAILLSILTSL